MVRYACQSLGALSKLNPDLLRIGNIAGGEQPGNSMVLSRPAQPSKNYTGLKFGSGVESSPVSPDTPIATK